MAKLEVDVYDSEKFPPKLFDEVLADEYRRCPARLDLGVGDAQKLIFATDVLFPVRGLKMVGPNHFPEGGLGIFVPLYKDTILRNVTYEIVPRSPTGFHPIVSAFIGRR